MFAKSHLTRRATMGVLASLLVGGIVGTPLLPAFAHETDCPHCKLPVVQDTEAQDNEVVLRFGRKRIEYRCLYCALVEAQTERYKGDVTILAPSENKGKPILISRKEGKWSVSPESAVFVGVNKEHKNCAVTYRAFTTRVAFDQYTGKNANLLKDAPVLSLTEILKVAAAKTLDGKTAPREGGNR
jgi:hypothetical protein